MESVAEAFRAAYLSDSDIRVFSKYCDNHREDFGLNELLYDVCVCRIGTCTSARQGKTLCYVREALWQIESEYAANSRQALFDFNKLVLGSAANRLFAGPAVNDVDSFLNTLLPAARCCSGTVYVALTPHPKDWTDRLDTPRIWQLRDAGWQRTNDIENLEPLVPALLAALKHVKPGSVRRIHPP